MRKGMDMRGWMVFVMFAMVGVMALGCMSAADLKKLEARLIESKEQYDLLMEQVKKLNTDKDAVMASIESGKLPVAEGMALVRNLEETKDKVLTAAAKWEANIKDIEAMKEEGQYNWFEILAGIATVALGGGGTGTVITRLLRGPSSKKLKNPDGSIRSDQ